MKLPHAKRSLLPLVAVGSTLVAACGPSGEREAEPQEGATSASTAADSPSYLDRLPDTPAGELLTRSLAHHDPDEAWLQRPIRLQWVSSQPDTEARVADLAIDNGRGIFALTMRHRGHDMDYLVEGDDLSVQVDGSTEIPPEVREAVSLHREDGLMWRNYFVFLAGLPMKLTDEAARLAAAPATTRFQGRAVEALKVTYETDDGYPHWAFYFDPTTSALVGARFWREAPDGDGEYIVMEGEIEAGRFRIPARRHWYMNADDSFLGTDEVRGLEVAR